MSEREFRESGGSAGVPPPPIPDHTLFGRIAAGAYGEVWLAQNALGVGRAVKIVRRDRFKDRRPYEREYAGIRKYEPISRTHDGLMDILQVGPENPVDWFYYVMELADDAKAPPEEKVLAIAGPDPGRPCPTAPAPHSCPRSRDYSPRTLRTELAQRGRLPVAECVRLGVALCHALEHLHRFKLVHRDLKPSNIIFVGGIPKLADAGLVTDTGDARSLVGTAGFVAPEGPGEPTADIYSLGRLLYEASTGKEAGSFPEPPTGLGNATEREAWAELNSVVLKACAADPRQRYPSAAALRGDLERLREGRSVRQLRTLQRRVRRLAVALAMLAVIASLALAAFGWQRAQHRRDRALQELMAQRQVERTRGWRDSLLASLRKANPGRGDLLWRSQAVAALEGLDARTELRWPTQPGRSIAFDSTSDRLVVGGPQIPTRWVALDPERVLAETEPGALAVTFDAQDRPLELRDASDGSLTVRTVNESQPVGRLVWPGPARADTDAVEDSRFRFAAQGSRVAGVRNRQLVLWELPSGQVRWTHLAETPVFAWDDEGRTVALALESGEILVCPTDGGGEFRLPPSARARPESLAFGRDPIFRQGATERGWLLAAGDSGGMITVWDLGRRAVRTQLRGSHLKVLALTFGPDSTLLASGGRAEARLWNLATGEAVLSGLDGDFHEELRLSPDGRRFGTVTRNGFGPGCVEIWSLEPSQGIRTLRGLGNGVFQPVFSPDGRRVTGVSSDWQLGMWDAESGRLLWAREAPEGISPDNVGLAFSPAGQLAYVAGRAACLWEGESGRELRSWVLPRGLVEALAFDRAGRLLSFRSEAGSDRLRDLLAPGGPRLLLEVSDFPGGANSAVLSPDGRTLILAGNRTSQEGQPEGLVLAIDTLDGRKLWSLNVPWSKPSTGSHLTMDTTGSVLGVEFFNHSKFSAVLEVRTGKQRPDLWYGIASSNGGKTVVGGGETLNASTFGFSLFEGGDRQFVFGLGELPQGYAALAWDGSGAAWSLRNGTLQVCHFNQARAELKRLGIPW